MIIEDYYGFPQNKQEYTELQRERSSNRTEKSNHNNVFTRKGPLVRTLKRTELSKQKLNSRDSKKSKKSRPLESYRPESSRAEQSGIRMTLNQQEAGDSNRKSLEMMVRKYDNYKNTESYEFKQGEQQVNHPPSNVVSEESYNQRGYRFQKETPIRRNRLDNGQQAHYEKDYRSASRGRREEFLVHFQKEGAAPANYIEKYVQNRSASNDIRAKKSRSLGAKLKPYKMHTFYNAEKRNYYNYNEEGYMTDRQHELLNRIEEKALKAFEKAAAESSNRRPLPEQKKRPARQFEIQQSSRVKHQKSGILQDLKKDSAYEDTPVSSRQQSKEINKNKKQQRVLELSINPKRNSSAKYDDYQMSISSKNKEDKIDDSQAIESKNASKQVKKDIFQKFAKEDSSDDISLLQFKPVKPKEQKNLEKEDSVKKSSEISNDYKSIDMMEINSNYKPSSKEIKERNEFIVDQNRSLGMDTIRNKPIAKKQVSKQSESNMELSNSNDDGSSSSGNSDSESKSESLKKSSKKSSESKRESEQKIETQKNKAKKSYSMSEVHSQSSLHNNSKKAQSNNIIGNFKKAANPLTQSERLVSSNASLEVSNSLSTSQPKIKIKRLSKAANKTSKEQPQQEQPNMGELGVQSFSQYDQLQPMTIKVKPAQKSKISERSPKSEMQPSINAKETPSKFKERASNSSFRQKSQASIAYRSKLKNSQHQNSNLEYDLFGQIRDFLEMQQFQYNEPRRAKEVRELIPDELDEVLGRIQDHLYIVNCMAEIILLVPDVYDFQTIYDKNKGWIFYQVFLTLKKYIFERGRVIAALSGGKNCFNLLNYQIQDRTLKMYLSRVEITNIRDDLEACNVKLNEIMSHFYNFLINFNKEGFGRDPAINLKPTRQNEDLVLLLAEYIKEVQTLRKKKEEQFKGGDLQPDDQEQYEMLVVLNERIFRLMEMAFIMSNLAGRQIKPCEKDEEIFQEQEMFKHYLFDNYDLFKETVKYFK